MNEPIEPRVWHCPLCHGHGTLGDAVIEIALTTRVRTYKPASKCWLCRGKGVVLVQPLPEGYAQGEGVTER